MAYIFTITTINNNISVVPNQDQFTITQVSSNVAVETNATLVQFDKTPATTSTLGAVIVGSGLSVDSSGTISVAMDDDSAYFLTENLTTTNVSTFVNDSGFITATDVTTQLGDIRFQGNWIRNVDTGYIYISPQDGNTWIYLPEDAVNSTTAISIANYAGGGVQIQTPSANYTFNTNGITFPDSSVQTSAYTGITTADITFTGSTLISNNNAPIEFYTQGGAVKVYNWGYPTDAMAIGNTQTGESIILQADGDGAQAKLRWHQTTTGTYNSIYSEVRTVATGVEIHNADWTSGATYDYKWAFNLDGGLTFPNLPTNSRTGNADALVFTKNGTQKSITTQGGTLDSPTVERLVIAGGDGYRDPETAIYTPYSEGGDVYLWAGRGANGGDIKVDAGNSYGVDGELGGDIKIRGGYSQSGDGGFIQITAGSGLVNGGDLTLAAGYGDTASGKVRVSTSNSHNWDFNADGTLSAPSDRLALKEGTYITTPSDGTGNKSIDLFTNDWNGEGVEVWLQHNDGVYIYTDNGSYGWAFKKDGGLTFPDTTVQTTAYTGQNIFDQSLNTTDTPTFANINILGTLTVVNTTVTNEVVVNKETITDSLTFGDNSTQTTAYVAGQTSVYNRAALPAGVIGLTITVSNSGDDENSPAGNYAQAYWDNDAEEWKYIANSNSVIVPPIRNFIDYLIVGGGASGGQDYAGGGGAGGVITGTTTLLVGAGTYYITVGAGGAVTAGGPTDLQGNNGNDSSFNDLIAIGGGAGGIAFTSADGGAGGSGGGAGCLGASGGAGTMYQGYAGGNSPGFGGAAGGGGAGAVGGDGSDTGIPGPAGAGGDGYTWFDGVTYAGGGGGGGFDFGTGGAGGAGGGGAGADYSTATATSGGAGTANLGGGGGGGSAYYGPGGAGGSGVVIIRHLDTESEITSTTGEPTVTTVDGYRYYTFTQSGSITV